MARVVLKKENSFEKAKKKQETEFKKVLSNKQKPKNKLPDVTLKRLEALHKLNMFKK